MNTFEWTVHRCAGTIQRAADTVPGIIGAYLFGQGCALCGTVLRTLWEARYGVCLDCRSRLTISSAARCLRCGKPLISEQGTCMSCREQGASRVDRGFALFPYVGTYRRFLRAYKFGQHGAWYRALGYVLAEKLLEGLARFPDLPADAVLIPVPPRPGKIRNTGWDQIDHLARILSQIHRERTHEIPGFPVQKCLQRLQSPSQKHLTAVERRQNLVGKIRYRSRQPVPRHGILFDDVITTGATLDACAATLKDAGVQSVWASALFYT